MSQPNELPFLKSARREALIVLALWLAATTWCVGYYTLYGYNRDPQTLTFVLGFPDWIFWGVIVPWAVCTIVSSVFAMFFMTDADLDS